MPVVELIFDADGALQGAREYDRAAKQVGRATDTVTNKSREMVNQLGKATLLGLSAAGAAFGAFALKSMNMASDLEETQGKFDVVFNGMTDTAEKWAKDLNQNYIMTQEQSKRFMSSIQDILVPMGVAKDTAGSLSYEVTKLAADLGSFNNLETEQVMNDIQSALVGNFETMKKYGVVLSATSIEQQILAENVGLTKDQITQAMKAEMAYKLILDASKAAVGDVARTQDGYANQLRQAKVLVSDLTTTLGEIFLPMGTLVLNFFNEWISKSENVNAIIRTTTETVRFLGNGFMGLVLAAKAVVVGITQMAQKSGKAIMLLYKPIENIAVKLGLMDAKTVPNLAKALDDLAASAIDGFQKSVAQTEAWNRTIDQTKTKLLAVDEATKKVVETTKTEVPEAKTEIEKMVYSWEIVKNAAGEYITVLKGMKPEAEAAAGAVAEAKNEAENLANTETKQKVANDRILQYKNNIDLATNSLKDATSAATELSSVDLTGGRSGGTSGGSRSTGRTEIPDWMTPAQERAYLKDWQDYRTNQDYIFGGGSASSRNHFNKPRQDPGTAEEWVNGGKGVMYSGGRDITINLSQSVTGDELAELIDSLERAEERQ